MKNGIGTKIKVIRNDTYARFRGKVYRAILQDDGTYDLFSIGRNIFKGNVREEETERIFAIDTFCKYKEYDFLVEEAPDNKYLIMTSNSEAYKKLGLDRIGRGEYQKLVEKSQIPDEDIYERETVLFGDKESNYSKKDLKPPLKPLTLVGVSGTLKKKVKKEVHEKKVSGGLRAL